MGTSNGNGQNEQTTKVSVSAYIAFAFALLFFSGLLSTGNTYQWAGAFDFNTIAGKFGTMKNGTNFLGAGGTGARQGFLFGFYLIPTVMLAMGMIELLSNIGALRAAQKLLTPLLKPLFGLPGAAAIIFVTNIGGGSDAGAVLTKQLRDEGVLSERQRIIMTGFQFSGSGLITNYFASGTALFAWLTTPIIVPFMLIIVMKFVGASLIRLYLAFFYKEDANCDETHAG
jgi:nucleoside recognition membrane protein YjiH